MSEVKFYISAFLIWVFLPIPSKRCIKENCQPICSLLRLTVTIIGLNKLLYSSCYINSSSFNIKLILTIKINMLPNLHSLDRLGRNKQMILDEWRELTQGKKIDIAVLDMPLLNTSNYKQLEGIETLISDIILQLLSYMAEDERKRISIRQREGVEAARRKGVQFGRRKVELPASFPSVYNDWKTNQITAVNAMDQLGLKRNTFYRRVKEYEESLEN